MTRDPCDSALPRCEAGGRGNGEGHCAAEKEQHKHRVFSKETKTQWKITLPKLAARGSRGESAGTRAPGKGTPESHCWLPLSVLGSGLHSGVAEQAGVGQWKMGFPVGSVFVKYKKKMSWVCI